MVLADFRESAAGVGRLALGAIAPLGGLGDSGALGEGRDSLASGNRAGDPVHERADRLARARSGKLLSRAKAVVGFL